MARVKQAQNDLDQAKSLYHTGLNRAYALHKQSEFFQENNHKLYIEALKDFAALLDTDADRTNDAIGRYREILDLEPQNSLCRLKFFQALCKGKLIDDAHKVLEEWPSQSANRDDQRAMNALCEMASMEFARLQLGALLGAAEDDGLRAELFGVFSDAAQLAGEKLWYNQQAQLMYVLAAGYINSKPPDDEKAIQIWQEMLDIPQTQGQGGWEQQEICDRALCGIIRVKFDEFRALIRTRSIGGSLSSEDAIAIRKEFQVDIGRLIPTYQYGYGDLYRYLAALCEIMNQPDWARDLLKHDVYECIGILCDIEPENDALGAFSLAKTLLLTGNDVDAHVAFSLLGRKARMTAELQTQDTATSATTISQEVNDVSRVCNLCERDFFASDEPDGFWACRWCPDTDLCFPCFESLKRREKHLEICSPEHEFVLLYHPECSELELEADKVFVDWRIVYDDTGKFTRDGGRLITVNEWLNHLRREWDLPLSTNNS